MYQMNREHYFDDRDLNREQRRALEKVKRQLIASYPDTLQVVPENDPNIPYSSHPQDIDKIYRSKKYTVIVWNVPAGKYELIYPDFAEDVVRCNTEEEINELMAQIQKMEHADGK